jgi:hypothetical protein
VRWFDEIRPVFARAYLHLSCRQQQLRQSTSICELLLIAGWCTANEHIELFWSDYNQLQQNLVLVLSQEESSRFSVSTVAGRSYFWDPIDQPIVEARVLTAKQLYSSEMQRRTVVCHPARCLGVEYQYSTAVPVPLR